MLWKFLKMHAILDYLLAKNVDGIAIQIYVTLITYLMLQLVDIPHVWKINY